MSDDFINQFGKPRPPRRDFADTLYNRIKAPVHHPARAVILRSLTIALTVVAVIAAALFVSPPARAFADGIIHRIGIYIFIQGNPQPDPTKQALRDQQDLKGQPDRLDALKASAIQAKPSGKPINQQQVEAKTKIDAPSGVDAATASQMAGYSVLDPAYIPEGYTPRSGWTVTGTNSAKAATISYQTADRQFMSINLTGPDPNGIPQSYTVPDVREVTVRGQPGVWLSGGKHSLVWVENGVTISIASTDLSLEEALKIAESMGK